MFYNNSFRPKSLLPEPTGLLSETIPSSRIEVVNSVVEPLVEKASDECSSSAKNKGKICERKFSADEKAAIGKRAAAEQAAEIIRDMWTTTTPPRNVATE